MNSKIESVLSCKNISKKYDNLSILENINFEIFAGESVAIIGSSGSGKSTFLHLLGGLDDPTSGEIFWNTQNIQQLSESKKCEFRNQHLGFIYQFHHLLPEFSALDNVAMPLLIRREDYKNAIQQAELILNQVGLGHRIHHYPAELSGGERQRVAIARALVTKPACILADEPTGNLDQQTAQQVFDLIKDLNLNLNLAFIIVTHDLNLANQADTIYQLSKGELIKSLSKK